MLKEASGEVIGYRNIDYNKQKRSDDTYYYKHSELACYTCIVGSGNLEKTKIENYPYNLKQAYYNALARERWNLNKLNVTL